MELNISTDMRNIEKVVDNVHKRQIPFVAHRAINKTAFDVQREEKRLMPRQIDRPKPYTKKGIIVKRSKNKRHLEGSVIFDRYYAVSVVKGATENPRNGKYLRTPTSLAKKDKYGNVTRATMRKMLKDMKNHFSGTPRGRKGKGLLGIWSRTKGNRAIKQVIRFEETRRRPKRLDFYKIADDKAKEVFSRHFSEQLEVAIANSKRR